MECPHCKKHVNESAISCPNCGKQLRFGKEGLRILKAFGILTTVWIIISMINVYLGIAIFGAVFTACGFLARQKQSKYIEQASNTALWPSVTGKVMRSRVYESGDDYYAKITYEYSLGDKTYVNDKIQFADNNLSESEARAVQARYPMDSNVSVYYDPADPANSILEQRSEWARMGRKTSSFLIIMGIITVLGAAVFYILK